MITMRCLAVLETYLVDLEKCEIPQIKFLFQSFWLNGNRFRFRNDFLPHLKKMNNNGNLKNRHWIARSIWILNFYWSDIQILLPMDNWTINYGIQLASEYWNFCWFLCGTWHPNIYVPVLWQYEWMNEWKVLLS